jgi:hypothetical protein
MAQKYLYGGYCELLYQTVERTLADSSRKRSNGGKKIARVKNYKEVLIEKEG